jgi:Flp pilus assembly pilin Flp
MPGSGGHHCREGDCFIAAEHPTPCRWQSPRCSTCEARASRIRLKNLLARFIREEEGQDVIEYALLAAFVSTIAGTVIVGIGGDVLAMFTTTAGRLPPA